MGSPLASPRPSFDAERPKGELAQFPLREKIQLRPPSQLTDQAFRLLIFTCAMSVLLIVGLIVSELIQHSQPSIHAFGWKFFTGRNWDPVAGDFGALPFIYGTVV